MDGRSRESDQLPRETREIICKGLQALKVVPGTELKKNAVPSPLSMPFYWISDGILVIQSTQNTT